MPTRNIVLLDKTTIDGGDIDFSPLESFGALAAHPMTSPAETATRCADAEVVLTNKVVIGADVMDACPKLKLIVVCATGTNNVDLEAARAHGVTVCNVSGYSTPSVAQHVFALLLNLTTHVNRYAAEQTQWADSPIFTRLDYRVGELSGKTMGIAGLGNIGRAVADVAKAFGMTVQALDRRGATTGGDIPRIEPSTFFQTSDVVSLHCPLTEDTHHLICEQTLDWMRPTAFLINTGRGDLVDEAALLAALQGGAIAGAGLDVLSTEPPPADNVLLSAQLPNLLITPHTAWASTESRRRLMADVCENIRTFLEGAPQNVVS